MHTKAITLAGARGGVVALQPHAPEDWEREEIEREEVEGA